jgi:hypothetical protein
MKLGKADDFETLYEPDKKTLARAISKFGEYGIKASVGG